MPFYLLGLGSNIQPEHYLPAARSRLLGLGVIAALSPVIRTQPVGNTFSQAFSNQLLILDTPLSAAALKAHLLALEEQLGREPKSPQRAQRDRTIDLDILHGGSLQACLSAPLEDRYYQQVQQQGWQQPPPRQELNS